jgi:multiple sugar transport system substrate-binding protein
MGEMLMKPILRGALIALMAGAAIAAPAQAETLVVYTDTSDPAPRQAFQELIDGFKAENPDITVEWQVFDHEGYKTQIRNFLTANAPDVAAWYAGNRMLPYVNANLFEDVSDLWEEEGLTETLASAQSSMTIGDGIWGVPYTYYQWGIYYRADIFEEQGLEVPATWDELLEVSAALKEAGITPFSIGTRAPWTTGGWFDYINLRTHGYDFHMELTNGEVPWTDDRVRETMANWRELIDPGYFTENPTAYDWQETVPFFVNGQAAMYLMGNFAVAAFREGGLTDDQIGFMPFPEITPDIPRAEDAPTDTLHIPANAKNKEDARKFLAYLARADVQTKLNETLGQLPVNSEADPIDDKFIEAGFELLSTADGIAQFFDRDAPAEMAQAGMEGFQEFMARPDNLDAILDRLERVRQRTAGAQQ